jgi:hypothetical protein
VLNVIVLGGNGALGRSVVGLLGVNSKINLYVVVRDKMLCSDRMIFWDYISPLPKQLRDADVLVNCARSNNFAANVAFNKILIRTLPPSVRVINISSNAVFAKPHGLRSRWLFKGDAYIREKKLIERESFNRDNTLILRPTVVTDEGGWKAFFISCKSAGRIIGPVGGENSRVKVTKRDHIAKSIENCILSKQDVPKELFESFEPVGKVIGREIVFCAKSYNFFNNSIKNVLTIILSSWLVSDRVTFFIQNAILNRTKSSDSGVGYSEVVIEGMTRLYLFGDHTK